VTSSESWWVLKAQAGDGEALDRLLRGILWAASTTPFPEYVTDALTSVVFGAAAAAFGAAAFGAACFGAAPAAWNISSAAAAIGITFMNASSGWCSLTFSPAFGSHSEDIQL